MTMPSFTPRNVVLGAVGLIAVLAIFMIKQHAVAFLVAALIIIVVVLGVVVWLIMRELEAAKAGKGIEKELDGQVEREIERSTFGQQAEVRNLKSEWDAAIAEFKKSPAGRRLGDKALATMPMYLLIGPSGAGKTTLIQESGLPSALTDASRKMRSVRGVGGARSFQWFFTEQAILLDMSGKSLKMSEFDDNEDWVQFLGSLRKMRPGRPINGAIMVVPAGTLAAGVEQVEPLAQQLRERSRDLGHHLGMEFPVYVVVTHCDSIAGFAETFASFDEERAGQPWGATLSLAKSRESAPEALFDTEFTTLVAALGDLRTTRVARLSDDVQRMRALAFPSQLERLRPELRRLVQVIFARGKGKTEGGLFRGFYLTSSRVGAPSIERVIGDAARAVNLAPRVDAPTPEVAKHSWFSQQLWRKIVFKDASLASADRFSLENEKRMRWVMFGGAVGAWLLMTAMLGIVSWNAASPVRAAAESARSLAGLSRDARPRVALRFLEPLRSSLAEIEQRRARKTFGMRVGGYAGDGVFAPAVNFYVQQASHFLIEPVVEDLQTRLRHQAVSDSVGFADLFYHYQAYRLLEDEHYEVAETDFVVFSKVLVSLHRPELQRVSDDSLGIYSRLMLDQARMLTDQGEPKHRFGRFDPALASAALAAIQRRWGEHMTLYDDMIADANQSFAPLTLSNIIPDKQREMLDSKGAVRGAYTLAGWQGFVKPRLDVMKQMVRREKDPQFVAQLGDDVRLLPNRLAGRYATDYVGEWVGFMNTLTARRDDLNGREYLLRESNAATSEIERVLRRVDAESRLGEGPKEVQSVTDRLDLVHAWLTRRKLGLFKDTKNKIPFMAKQSELAPQERFRASLMTAAKDKKGVQSEIYENGAQFQAWSFTAKESSPYPGELDPVVGKALRSVLTVMRPGPGGAGGAGGAGTRAGGGGAAVGPANLAALATDWGGLVVAFSEIQDRYPFDGGGDGVGLNQFTGFFGPTGALEKLYTTHLQGRVSRDGELLDPLFPLPAANLAWLKKAFAIQRAFFGNSAEPKLEFDVKTRANRLQPATRLHSVTWHVGDKEFFYEMGGEENTFLDWKSDNLGKGSWVSADLDGSPVDGPKFADEDWGLFRVLDRAALSPSGDHVIATWVFKEVHLAVEITPRNRTDHPFRSGFLRLGPPPPADF
ncbi:MAG: type VI secretion system membrane subunit TssM [Candidatus Eisenbacteria bacterium]|nr:type VI secretion system membrane subunit TssM [Candidatus Eisenbacteria bacterium]